MAAMSKINHTQCGQGVEKLERSGTAGGNGTRYNLFRNGVAVSWKVSIYHMTQQFHSYVIFLVRNDSYDNFHSSVSRDSKKLESVQMSIN